MLAILRRSAEVMPTTTPVGPADLVDRIASGHAWHVIVDAANTDKVPGNVAAAPPRLSRAGDLCAECRA